MVVLEPMGARIAPMRGSGVIWPVRVSKYDWLFTDVVAEKKINYTTTSAVKAAVGVWRA